MILRAKNWTEFQHYKDRAPAWIKLHRRLLDDRVFQRLPDASRALAPMLWLLASESEEGIIKDAIPEIAFRLRMPEAKVEAALKPLTDNEFFIVEQDASKPLAERKPDASSEERESKRREEREAFEFFVNAAKRKSWPCPSGLSKIREQKLRSRLAEHGLDGWNAMLAKAETSEFICGGMSGWSLDWVLEPKNFTKVIEGNYDNRPTAPYKNGHSGPTPPTTDNDSDGQWRARLRSYRAGGFWMAGDWGPRPESGQSRVPSQILVEWTEAQPQAEAAA